MCDRCQAYKRQYRGTTVVIHRAVRGLLAPLGGAAVYTYDRTVTIVPMVSPIMYWMFLVLARSNTSTHGYDLG